MENQIISPSPDEIYAAIRNLRSQIDQFLQYLPDVTSLNYQSSQFHLQQYIMNSFKIARNSNEKRFFIDELFVSISLAQLSQNTLHYLALITTIIDIDLGDKVLKANRIARDLLTIQPEPNPLIFQLLTTILLWLDRSLRSSMQIITNTFLETSLKFCKEQDQEKYAAGLMLWSLLLKHFPTYTENQFSEIPTIVIQSFKSQSKLVKKAALNFIQILLNYSTPSFRRVSVSVLSELNKEIVKNEWKKYKYYIKASELIISKYPDLSSQFFFQELPLSIFNEKDIKLQKSACLILPFIFRVAPDLFTNETINKIFTIYDTLTSKKSNVKKQALLSIAYLLFLKIDTSSVPLKLLQKFHSHCEDSLELPQAIYCLLSLDFNCMESNFLKDEIIIFSKPLSSLVASGLQKMIETYPKYEEVIQTHVAQICFTIILHQSSSKSQIILAFNSLSKMKINQTFFKLPILVRLLAPLSHPDLEVRKACLSFALMNQTCADISLIILRSMIIELNQNLRAKIVKGIQYTSDPKIISLLHSLLHDSFRQIREEALRSLSINSNLPLVESLLTSFLLEKIPNNRNENLNKEDIKCFLIVASQLPRSQNILRPFAQFLVEKLFDNKDKLPTCAFELLSKIIELAPNTVDVDKLAHIVSDSLTIESSPKRLDAAIEIILTSLKYTDLKSTIYTLHSELFAKLVEISHVNSISFEKLNRAFASIGPLNNSIVQSFKKTDKAMIKTAQFFIAQNDSNDPYQSISYASVGVALSNILLILQDNSLSALHVAAINSLLIILRSYRQMGRKLQSFLLKQIHLIVTQGNDATVSLLLSNISSLISVLGQSFSPLIPHVVNFIIQKWEVLDKSLLLRISEWMMMYLENDFSKYLPQLAVVYVNDMCKYDAKIVDALVGALVSFNQSIERISHIIYPKLLDWIMYNAQSTFVVNEILAKMKLIFISGGISNYAISVIRASIFSVKLNRDLQAKLLEIISVVAVQCGSSFLLYLPLIEGAFDLTTSPLLISIIQSLKTGSTLSPEAISLMHYSVETKQATNPSRTFSHSYSSKSTPLIGELPRHGWNEEKWQVWSTKLFSNCLFNSSSRAISALSILTQKHNTLQDVIYPLAFILAYIQQNDNTPEASQFQKSMLDTVLSSTTIPKHILKYFLKSLELMEIMGLPIPISKKKIANSAIIVCFYQQALRTTEYIFEDKCNSETIKTLVQLNQKLGLKLAATGILRYAQLRNIKTNRATLSELLGLWEDALKSYQDQLIDNPDDPNLLEKKFKCYEKLLRFNELRDESKNKNNFYEAIACWSFFDYDNFLRLFSQSKKISETSVYEYYHAIYLILRDDFNNAKQLIYSLLDQSRSIFPINSFDDERIISEFSYISSLSILLDVIKFKKLKARLKSPSPIEQKNATLIMNKIITSWNYKFDNLAPKTFFYFQFLTLESLVLNILDIKNHWLKFMQTAIDQKDYSIAQSVSTYLQKSISNDSSFINELKILDCDLLWSIGKQEEAITQLMTLREIVEIRNELNLSNRIDFTLAKYLMHQDQIIESYNYLNNLDSRKNNEGIWLKVNLLLFQSTNNSNYLLEYFRSLLEYIQKTHSHTLSLSLQILSVLFQNGNKEIYKLFTEKVNRIPIQCWIESIPQIIARFSSKDEELRDILQNLIYQIGAEHPNAVLYPLLVPFKSEQFERRDIASSLFDRLRNRYQSIVNGIVLLANELIRVASSWMETIKETLEEYSRAFIIQNDIPKMMNHIQFILNIVKTEPETFYEVSFLSQFGRLILDVEFWLTVYDKTKDEACLHQICQQLLTIYNLLCPIIDDMKVLPLIDVSPTLSQFHHDEIAIPGSFETGKSVISIKSFGETMTIIKSKQRPRKMQVLGNNGEKYTFLLKAHEDTRLDERVIQLFNLINTLFNQSDLPLKSRLSIETYKVIPLTAQVGLIGWVPDCSTLFDLLKEYREKHNIQIQIEYMTMQKATPNYQSLPIEQKVKIFQQGIASSPGLDLRHVLLYGAIDSADWLHRRTTYTASLASTSIAGYILGLGDRHFCNIMMKSKTAKLVHIDFGDCFEVAMRRANFPEKVSIRLTRILINALEVSKIEGTFRSCCENVMNLMRINNENIMSLLEAFIFDPLMQWSGNNDDQNNIAVQIVDRIRNKLTGNDFQKGHQLSIQEQVEALIEESTDPKNLCQMFKGWSPCW